MRVKCLFCDVENDAVATSGYCDNCGKKLPNSAMVRTRREIAASNDNESAISTTTTSRTAEALFTLAVVHLGCGGLFLVLGPSALHPVPAHFLTTTIFWTVLPTILFAASGVLARSQPKRAIQLSIGLYVVWIVTGWLSQPQIALPWSVVHAVMIALLTWTVWMGRRS